MSDILLSLLALDAVGRRAGCGLCPRLRDAIEVGLRIPALSSGPVVPLPGDGSLPDGVVLFPISPGRGRRQA